MVLKWKRTPFVILPFVVGVNFLLLALSFSHVYEGTMEFSGLAERLFGSIRLFGWRGDIVWLFFSTIFVAAMGLLSIKKWRTERSSKRSLLLCTCWAVGAVVY